MLDELKIINLKQLKSLETLLKNINKSAYKKIYLFPSNTYSNFLYKKLKKDKTYIVDNYLQKKNCIKPNKIDFHINNILIVTDKNVYESQKFTKKLPTIFYIPKLDIKPKINLDQKKLINGKLSKLFRYFNSDKAKVFERLNSIQKTHNYGKFYDKHFKKLKDKKLNILEVGSYRGSSSASFFNYFSNSKIYCVDLDHKNFLFCSKRIKLIKLDYMNKNLVSKFCKTHSNFFDIIIDDGGHYKSHMLNNLNNFSTCLKKKSSMYIIEDYGLCFNYLNDIKNEPTITHVINSLKNKRMVKSKILYAKTQNRLIDGIKKIFSYKGSWIKYKKNISNICFLEIINLKNNN